MGEAVTHQRGYEVDRRSDHGGDWIVNFFVDGETVGHAILRTAEQADEAGVEFMFSGKL